MNKFLTKIAVAFATVAMAVGVGVAVASNSKSAVETHAADLTAEKTTNTLVTENGWTVSSGSNIGDIVTSFALDSNITISTSGSANCGTIWGTTTNDWRLYQNKSGDVTATAASGYIIKSVAYTYTVSSNGKLYNGSTAVNSGSSVSVNGSSKTLTVGATSGTSGQVRITNFKVVYEQQASQSVNIGNDAKIDSTNGLSITATMTGISGTASWSANPNTGVSFTSGNTTKMTVANTVANGTVISVTATVSGVTSNTKKVVVSNHSGTSQADAFEADEATALVKNNLFDANTTYYVGGYIKTSSYSEVYSNATAYITTSDDNESTPNTDCFELFKAVGATGVDVTELQHGFYVIASGKMSLYNSQAEFNGCTVLSVETPAVEVDDIVLVINSSADAQGASHIEQEAEYDVYYVDTVGLKTISVHIENSQGEETGYTYTTPSGGTFTIDFTANETYTVTITSLEDDSFSTSEDIVITGIVQPTLEEFEPYSSSLIAGEYIFLAGGLNYVLGTGDNGGRVDNGTLPTITNNKISTDDYSIIWEVAVSGDYFTIQNKDNSKYLAGTGVNNKATLIDTVTDYAKWSVSVSDGLFDFVNYGNAQGSKNPYLRNNGDYGWACYATGTGTKVKLFSKINSSRSLTGLAITTPASKTSYNTGEALNAYDLVVRASFSAAPLTVDFSDMTSSDTKGLTFSPALGTVLTSTGEQTVTISYTYNNHTESTSFTITVSTYVATTYTKVSSLSADLRGTYLVVYENDSDAYILNSSLGSSSSTMDVVSNYVSGTISNNQITGNVTIDAAAVQIVRDTVNEESKYFLKSSVNTYFTSTASKLNVSDSTAAGNALTIQELNDGLRPFLGENVIKFNTANNQMRFRVYASSGSSAEVSLYKLNTTDAINNEVSSFVSDFNTNISQVCDPDGKTNNITASAWNTQSSAFHALSADAQGILASATESSGSAAQNTAIHQYDYIVNKYSYADFMNRVDAGTLVVAELNNSSIFSINSETTTALVVIIATLGITSIGAIFFIRRRKSI